MRREPAGHTLQPTAIVHEAYLRLADQTQVRWQNRAHFLGVTAQKMRCMLVDHARARGGETQRRLAAGHARREHLGGGGGRGRAHAGIIALDAALKELAAVDEQKARIVELRFCGGLSVEETAAVLGINEPTVKRHWRMAKTWLHGKVEGKGEG